jgi:hypothetical protein
MPNRSDGSHLPNEFIDAHADDIREQLQRSQSHALFSICEPIQVDAVQSGLIRDVILRALGRRSRGISYAVFCLKKKKSFTNRVPPRHAKHLTLFLEKGDECLSLRRFRDPHGSTDAAL